MQDRRSRCAPEKRPVPTISEMEQGKLFLILVNSDPCKGSKSPLIPLNPPFPKGGEWSIGQTIKRGRRVKGAIFIAHLGHVGVRPSTPLRFAQDERRVIALSPFDLENLMILAQRETGKREGGRNGPLDFPHPNPLPEGEGISRAAPRGRTPGPFPPRTPAGGGSRCCPRTARHTGGSSPGCVPGRRWR